MAILVSVEGQQRAEAARITQEATVMAEKAAREGKRGHRGRHGDTGAHAAAEGAMGTMDAIAEGARDAMDEECGDGGEDSLKGYREVGITEGPGRPVRPGQIQAQDFARGPLAEGRAALSPQHEAPRAMPAEAPHAPYPMHVDLTHSSLAVAVGHEVHPTAPSGPGGQR